MAKPLERILYVEDEPDIRTVALVALEDIGGFHVLCCASGREAIEKAPAFAPDLLLLDVMMPGLDGPATLRELRALPATAGTPVVFLTAKVQRNDVEFLNGLGALEVIAKPFDPIALAPQLREAWRRKCDSVQPRPRLPPELQALFRGYAEQIPGMLAELEDLWGRARSSKDPEGLKRLHLRLHSIAGAAGTFGFAQLGKDAKALELALAPYLEDGVAGTDVLDALSPLLERIRGSAAAARP